MHLLKDCLDVTNGILESVIWMDCPELPKGLTDAKMITNPESGSLILIGGSTSNGNSGSIFELSEVHGHWEEIGQLREARSRHISFFVKDTDLVYNQDFIPA